jgi:HSP20 family protein
MMNVIKYDPFRELRGLHDEMNRLLSGGSSNQAEFSKGTWSPSVDIFEDENQLVIEAELPGMGHDDIEVLVENNVLTLKGERKFEKSTNTDNYHRVERSYGAFTRQFTLPQSVRSEGATANFRNGVLRIGLQKREETKARKINITGGDPREARIDELAKSDAANA